ncbi:hypothetical protein KCP91_12185 [Microvirga sp. SRT01]|uniref:Uncharacterized protein n=1 Tax=Sphingomonas longa TaxID=2778730 RepID=A0ABS2D865_9SPHN|nr:MULTISPECIES: hypothetical protein [Alphaproteobacteria]MBM6577132.1 hypothetical protein [Sphingomonas sp. BT552]MBR7710176.1 hypothetical protein [Microvirga sp. SRT01]
MRAIKYLGWIGAGLWSVLVLLASNSPKDVQERASGWMSLPVVRSLPDWIMAVAGSRWTLAITCLSIGVWLGWWLRDRKNRAERVDPLMLLGERATNLAYDFDNVMPSSVSNHLISEFNIVIIDLTQVGIPVPAERLLNKDRCSFYLHHVGKYLSEGRSAYAKTHAEKMIAGWERGED